MGVQALPRAISPSSAPSKWAKHSGASFILVVYRWHMECSNYPNCFLKVRLQIGLYLGAVRVLWELEWASRHLLLLLPLACSRAGGGGGVGFQPILEGEGPHT